ncbi:MAG: O-antigen ligase family protein [Verrucomicrobiales bacterium]|nr:O-antigen ligase family protein [Verrucomicrobiales bacterium]MCP5527703.1 O-antigen ligase family protein [Verrucomicrobiales bacterium]
MEGERLDHLIERSLAVLVLGALGFATLATGAVRDQDFAVVQAIVAVATALWVARFWVRSSGPRLQWPPVCWAIVAFVAYAVLRYAQADVEYVARKELMRILVYAWLFFIVLNNLYHSDVTRKLVYALLGLATVVSMYALYQVIARNYHVWGFERPEVYAGRGSGTFICPNHLAGFLEMLLPLALAMLLLGRDKILNRVFIAYAALVILAGIGASISRGGWLSCGVALLVLVAFMIRFRNHRWLALSILLVTLVGGGLFVWKSRTVRERFTLMFTGGQLQDVSVRWWLSKATAAMWRDHFWLGVGPAHFDVRFPQYRPPELQSRPYWAHNDYLNVLADWGAVGGGILVAGVLLVAVGVPRTWRFVHRGSADLVTKRSDRAAHVLGVAVGMVALGVHTALDFNLQIPANAILATVLVASLSSHLRFATRKYWMSPNLAGRITVSVLGLVTVVVLGQQSVQRWREARAMDRALDSTAAETQLAALEAAVAIEPKNPDSRARLGEFYRLESWEGSNNWKWLAGEALKSFERGMELNRWETYNFIRAGMCLDWLGEPERATPLFERAVELDPNNHHVVMMRGWHEIQREDYAEARRWLNRSLEIWPWSNFLARRYLLLVERRLAGG